MTTPLCMQFESRITWEKLSLELELLSSEDPRSLVPLLIGVNSVLWPSDEHEWTFRNINFMGYELNAKTEGLGENDRFDVLNDFFFHQKSFQINSTNDDLAHENDYMIKSLLAQKSGATLTIALLYMHLASQIDLPVYLVNLPSLCILKWVRSGKSNYINISEHGRLMPQEELLEILHSKDPNIDAESEHFDILPQKRLLLCYLHRLNDIYKRNDMRELQHVALNITLKIDPSSTKSLGERALLRRDLGLNKDSIADLKRYFSFIDKNTAPPDIKMAYYEMQALQSAMQNSPAPGSNLLH